MMNNHELAVTGYGRPRAGRVLVLGIILACASPLAVAHGRSGNEVIDSPGLVQMIDGKDPGNDVQIRIHAPGLRDDGYDFGYMDGQTFHPLTGWCGWGNAVYSSGTHVDFALRKRGDDDESGTSDAQYYRLSDAEGYATQDYFNPVNPSDSRHPVVTDPYYRKLTLYWDLDRDNDRDMKVMLWAQNNFDGMRFDSCAPPAPVPLPPSVWLLGSGMLVLLGLRGRRRREAT
ncbi:MAG: hypothetical protein ACYDDO_04675 [Acidiferrobacterales bacterium]